MSGVTAQRPIFIVGCPRSGTTLLSSFLHAHPRIAMPPETRFLLPIYRDRARFGDLRSPANRRRLALRIVDSKATRFTDLGLDRDETVRAIVRSAPTLGTAFATVWQQFAHSRGKTRWGAKRPIYTRYLDVVLRLFPDAQIVHLVRDGRACVASLARLPWWKSGAEAATAVWTISQAERRRDSKRLPSDTFYSLRYEDLVRDPEPVLHALCEFLGEDFDPAMLEHTAAAGDIVPQRKRWHSNVRRPIDAELAESWRTTLSPAELALVERVGGSDLLRNGYPLTGEPVRPSAGSLLRYQQQRATRLAAVRRRQWADLRQRRRDPNPLGYQL